MRREEGFTLIELLTIVGIISLIALLAISSFSLYKSKAAYAVASGTLHDARNALEASLVDPDNPPPAVSLRYQDKQGAIDDPLGRQLLTGLQMPRNLKLQYAYDPSCIDESCEYEAFLQSNRCDGQEMVRWVRYGVGVEVMLEHIAEKGCP